MSARNFGPIMAAAAKISWCRCARRWNWVSLDPEHIVTPGIFVKRVGSTDEKIDRKQMAARAARDIPEGAYVNLGIGLPTLVADYPAEGPRDHPAQRERHPRRGAKPAPGMEDEDLMNAGKEPVTLLTGGAYFHHADSFAMIRGRHLDFAILGAFQVSVAGDLANWHTGGADASRGRRCDGPRGGREEGAGDDGAPHQERREQDRRALHLSAHRRALRRPDLHRSRGDRRRPMASTSSTWSKG